jgi:hypothetical protein
MKTMSTSCKSALAILFFVFFTLISFGQSKKEQIEILNNKLDSIQKITNQLEADIQIRNAEIESLQNRIQLELEKNKKSSSENASLNEKLKSEQDEYLRKAAVLKGFEEKNKELIDRIEAYTSVILSDSLRLKFLCGQRVPKNTHLLSALIHDVNNDKFDDFLIFFQDTINCEWDDITGMYLSPAIFEIHMYSSKNKSIEIGFHCEGLFDVWGSPWSEEFYIEPSISSSTENGKGLSSKNSSNGFIIKHYGLSGSHESETMEFLYHSQTKDFSLMHLEYSYMERLSPDHGGYSLDFDKKKFVGMNKKSRTIDFPAPALSAWPNASWKDVLKIRDLE